MDINVVASLIGSLGFPIVSCGFLAWFIYKVVLDLQKTIEHNTKIMEKILTKLDMDEGDENDDK
ncbi:MAG: hypothetical protein MJZ03_03905 [archaeon]|nr:hypothetical protein [archaeon]